MIAHATSSSTNLPFDVFNADLVTCFLVIVEPLSLAQIDARELGARLTADGLPFALLLGQSRQWRRGI